MFLALFNKRFQNMIQKPEEKEVVQENALAMIQCKVLKQLEVLQGQKIEDPDITEDIEFLIDKLQNSMVDLRWVPCGNRISDKERGSLTVP